MTPEEQSKAIDSLERRIERLSALYNQYFMGIEKLEPTIARKEVDRLVALIRREGINNSVQRFRFQTQLQKYNTQSTYWRRVSRQIEEGTYQRHVMRAKKRTEMKDKKRESTVPEEVAEATPTFDLGDMDDFNFDDPFKETGADAMSLLDDPFAEVDASAKKLSQPVSEPSIQHNRKTAEGEIPPTDDGFSIDVSFDDSASVPKSDASSRRTSVTPVTSPQNETNSGGDKNAMGDFFRQSVAPPPPPPPPISRAPKRAPKPAPAPKPSATTNQAKLEDERAKKIYRTYLAAKKRCNESTDVSYEKVARSLRKQYESKKGNVDFKVVIRDGKAVIKTVKN